MSLMANTWALVQPGPADTGIREVLETVQARTVAVLIGKLPGDQVVLVEAMVDLDVELVVVAVVRTRSKPVVVDSLP